VAIVPLLDINHGETFSSIELYPCPRTAAAPLLQIVKMNDRKKAAHKIEKSKELLFCGLSKRTIVAIPLYL
jgi:hypothetical protein